VHTVDVLRHPDAPMVQEAWRLSLQDLQGLVDLCRERRLPLQLALFPIQVQLEEPGLDAPQRSFAAFAERNGVPLLDLLPVLARGAEQRGVDPSALFIDTTHLTPLGTQIVADRFVEWIDEHGGVP
jgi:lysophospholipase L1-like esterase